MNFLEERKQRILDRIYRQAKKIEFDNRARLVMMSDMHRGDGSGADQLVKNQHIYSAALSYYFRRDYTYFELGDGDDLWLNRNYQSITRAHGSVFFNLSKFFFHNRYYMLYGNHDMIKKKRTWVQTHLTTYEDAASNEEFALFPNICPYEAIVLVHKESAANIFLVHGHQVDSFNYDFWLLSRFLFRRLWRPLQLIGIQDPVSASNNIHKKMKVERHLIQWTQMRQIAVIAGHTHRVAFPLPGEPAYFNDGCCVHPYILTAIEIIGGAVQLVKWQVTAQENGALFVNRSVIKESMSLAQMMGEQWGATEASFK